MKKTSKWIEQWMVESHSHPGIKYRISRDKNWKWGCTCRGWIFSKKGINGERRDCKHIRQVKEEEQLQVS